MTRDFSDDNLKEAAIAVYYHVAQMVKAGKSPAEIEQALLQHGIRPETTQKMLEKLAHSHENVYRRHGRRNLAVGLVLVGLGVLLISGGPKDAGAFFAWLSVLIGSFWLFRGVLQLREARRYERAN